MGSGQSHTAFESSNTPVVKTRSGGKSDPVNLLTPSPPRSRTLRRRSRALPVSSARIDPLGWIKKLSPAAKTISQPSPKEHHVIPKQSMQVQPGSKVSARQQAPAKQAARTSPIQNTPIRKQPTPEQPTQKIDSYRPGLRSAGRARSRSPVNSVVLSFQLQHTLLVATQKLLEGTLHYWTDRWVPIILQAMQWETADAGELNKWIGALKLEAQQVKRALVDSNSGIHYNHLLNLIFALHKLRNAAVHRSIEPTHTITSWMKSALQVVYALGDALRQRKMAAMEGALRTRDLSRLEVVVGLRIEDFADAAPEPVELPAAQPTSVTRPSNIAPGLSTNIDAQGQKPKTTTREGRKILPSTEREFGARLENHQSMVNGIRSGSKASFPKRLTRVEVIDLTEEGEDALDIVKKAPNRSDPTTAKEGPVSSKKRSLATFQQDLIEISDDDQDYPNEYDDEEEDELPDKTYHSYIPESHFDEDAMRLGRIPGLGNLL
ncbi:hypothetical protein VTL71DRAFT_3188 [Oculimacula yallundae]|uniref:Uncharacterized protein n=1 Tax=Oculimacula yallundae TaxID=86028 RepID=A0ABR4C6F8_9HELO